MRWIITALVLLAGLMIAGLISCSDDEEVAIGLQQGDPDDPELQFLLGSVGKGAGEYLAFVLGYVDMESKCALSGYGCDGNVVYSPSLNGWTNDWQLEEIRYSDTIKFLVNGEVVRLPSTSLPFQLQANQTLTARSTPNGFQLDGEHRLELRAERDYSRFGKNYAKVNGTGRLNMLLPGDVLRDGVTDRSLTENCRFQVDFDFEFNQLTFGGKDGIDPTIPWAGSITLSGTTSFSCPGESAPRVSGDWSIRMIFRKDSADTRVVHDGMYWDFEQSLGEDYFFWNSS